MIKFLGAAVEKLKSSLAELGRFGSRGLGTKLEEDLAKMLTVAGHKPGRGKRRYRHRYRMQRTRFHWRHGTKYRPHEGERQKARQRGELKEWVAAMAVWKAANPNAKFRGPVV